MGATPLDVAAGRSHPRRHARRALRLSGERLIDHIMEEAMILTLGTLVTMAVHAVREMLRERPRKRQTPIILAPTAMGHAGRRGDPPAFQR